VKKNLLNQLEFKKNQPVQFNFGFISLKPKKSNRTQTKKKPSQTGKELSQTGKKPNQTGKTESNRNNQAKPKKIVFVLK
jgi:hypothetical protein